MLPSIIQGGMGVGVSDWRLARAVALRGQLGVVSGTALDSVLVRRLQDGDVGGHIRRALASFPLPDVAQEIVRRFFNEGGRRPGEAYRCLPLLKRAPGVFREKLLAAANFVEVFLARHGHSGPVGINYLTKIQVPTLASLYGAMLAGVDYVLMGAGIPFEIPGALDQLADNRPARIRLDVQGKKDSDADWLRFSPEESGLSASGPLKRPGFLPIASSNSLVTLLARRSTGTVNGVIIEGPTAGGHNAPPRGKRRLNDRGEPVYGERDRVDLESVAAQGLPFWVAGGCGHAGALTRVRDQGGTGIQVGTLFAYCDESGLDAGLKRAVFERCRAGTMEVITEDRASPTGFPFKSVGLPKTLASREVYENRTRVCDLGYLRTIHRGEDDRLSYRCAGEPVSSYVASGGSPEDTIGRKCLCNALMADIGLGQVRDGGAVEPPLLTSGDDLAVLGRFLGTRDSYTAADVIDYLLEDG